MEWQVELNNKSFDRAGITKDCKEAICEYIWNGFEAGATEVTVSFDGIPMQKAMSVRISDNGKGIEYEDLKNTFGAFLSSIKNSINIRIKSRTNKGKGRFSYLCFSHSAKWDTVYEKDGVLKKYSIFTDQSNKRSFSTTEILDVTNETTTGTVVELPLNDGATISNLAYSSICQKLFQEFSWFLYLNKRRNFCLKYCNVKLDYNQYIDCNLSSETVFNIEGEQFLVNLIVWNKNIDNPSKIYYLSDNGEIHAAKNTGFNKNSVNFFHDVFVVSDYINSQNTEFWINSDPAQRSLPSSEKDKVIFGKLGREISKLIAGALNEFLIREADNHLELMEKRGSFPVFQQDEYGQLRKRDFEIVTKELFCVEPKIFYKLNDKQEKSLLGFMNLLLSSEERENLLTIVEGVTSLTAEQRKSFANVLHTTKMQYIIELIGIIERRMGIIEQLKKIIFDMTKFANERNHIQKIIEQHFWLFGEQYHLLTADKTLANSLAEFEKIIQSPTSSKKKKAKGETSQRTDIFMYTQRIQDNDISEMIIIELKAPYINLTDKVFAQAVRYANTIRKEPRFNGQNRVWRFYVVCTAIDENVKTKYSNFKHHGKLGLADIVENFEIYALTWDDVFQAFESRHSFLLKRLKFNFSQAATCPDNGSENKASRALVNDITDKILHTST
jgi:hypothetical protein